MQETNDALTTRESDQAWQDRAARREQMRRNTERMKKKQQAVMIGLILLLAVVIGLVAAFASGWIHLPALAAETAAPTVTSTGSDPSTEPPTTLPPETEPPTLPPMTWMAFQEGRELTARQYFVYDVDADAFLTISGQPDELIYPASVTKLFTAYVALEHLALDKEITAGSALDLVDPESSIAGIQRGDTFTTEKLVEAMLLLSGNDAACILAVETGRTLAEDPELGAASALDLFMDEVNRQLNLLGMTGTYFTTPDGIRDDNHHTCFADLAAIGKLVMENETIMKYASVARETVTLGGVEGLVWKNTNSLINPDSDYYCPYALGLKTGQTSEAGSCLLSAFSCNGQNLIIGVFGCPTRNARFPDTLQLFNETMGFPYAEPEPTVPPTETTPTGTTE